MIRYLLTLAFVLFAAPCFAVFTRTYTVKQSGGDYTTVAAAESAIQQDLVANDSAITFEISGIWTIDDGLWNVNGWTTDATRFPTITAIGDSKAGATWSTTAYRTVGPSTLVIKVQENFTIVDGLQAEATITDAFATSIISITSVAANVIVSNCFLKGNATGTGITGIGVAGGSGSGFIIRNTIVIDCIFRGIDPNTATAGIKIDNNTIENCGIGIRVSGGDVIARNNILWNTTTPLTGNFNVTTLSEENYTDAASLSYGSCGSCGTGDQLSQSDPFVSVGDENYHLASGATAIDAGKDLSADFTDAIGGKTRTDGFFDKGADEFISAAVSKRVLIRKAMMFWVW